MECVFDNQNFKESDVVNMPSTSLAFVGDAFFTLFARSRVLNIYAKSGKFHKKATEIVKAQAQSQFLVKLLPHLCQQEQDIVRRAKNTRTTSKSKNAGLADYKKATAFEALLGYLFLTRQSQRLSELLKIVFDEVLV